MTTYETSAEDMRALITEFEDNLASYRAELAAAEQRLDILRCGRASLQELSETTSLLNAARETVVWLERTIELTRREVCELEAADLRSVTLAQLGSYAADAAHHWEQLAQTVLEGGVLQIDTFEKMHTHLNGLRAARQAFGAAAIELAPGFRPGEQAPALLASAHSVVAELEALGVPLTDVLNSASGRYTSLDSSSPAPLPGHEHGPLLWYLLWEGARLSLPEAERHVFRDIQLPLKPN